MKNDNNKRPVVTQWIESGVSLGQVLGTTTLLAMLPWATNEKPDSRAPADRARATAKPEPPHVQRRILTPPVEATA